MPVYEYVCSECNDRFDRLVRRFDEADTVRCEAGDSHHVRRVVSGFAVVGGLDQPVTSMPSSGGGCCGGSCGCGH